MSEKTTYRALRPIGGKFGLVRVGETVELTEDEAKNIGAEYVTPAKAPQEAPAEGGEGTAKTLEEMEVKDLKELAEAREVEVPARGKAKIIEALREAGVEGSDAPEEGAEGTEDTPGEGE